MYSGKRVLLIAGGGTLGTYVSEELLRLGATVEVICPEEKISDNERLLFHRSMATEELLTDLFSQKHYDGIVNFLHYREIEEYKRVHPLLIKNTDHLIFLSSYRVYADVEHPITEKAPRLFDVVSDPDFFENEKYAVPKSKCENYLMQERADDAWTIVRPVISFSNIRMDLLMYSGDSIIRAAERGEELLLPLFVKDFVAGFDWAGNSGKLIANLLFKPETVGEIYSIYSGHGLTWGEIASAYERITGVKIRWCDEKEYLDFNERIDNHTAATWSWKYDRCYNRDVDASKVLRVTGLSERDFSSIDDGIKIELAKMGKI